MVTHSWHILHGEFIGRVTDQQAFFTTAFTSDKDSFKGLHHSQSLLRARVSPTHYLQVSVNLVELR